MFRNFFAYFRHHRSERNGTIAILVILFITLATSQVYFIWHKPAVKENTEFLALIDSLKALASAEDGSEHIAREESLEPFLFNPNTLSDSGYAALGFSEKEVNTLRNYQKAGATFEIKTDFKKLFFVNDERYENLKPFIDLPDTKPKKEFKKPNYAINDFPRKRDTTKWSDTTATKNYEYKPFTCDLNLADTTELKKLPYIGPFFARNIVKYRGELGGYHSLAQLLEIYNMTPESIDKFAKQLTIDKSKIRKINVNTATTQELSAHPYISFPVANAIVSWRESKSNFKNMDKLCATGLLNAELCVKLAPYLIF